MVLKKRRPNSTGTLSVFGYQMRYDLKEGFPCVTTKKLHLRSIVHELYGFKKEIQIFLISKENKVSIWDEWADKEETLARYMVLSGGLGQKQMGIPLTKLHR